MTDSHPSLERRLDDLTEQVRALSARLDEFVSRGVPAAAGPTAIPPAAPEIPQDSQEISLQWPNHNVLQSVAAACFILVVALMLRTVADSGAIHRGAGLILGLLYAAILVAHGYRRHARGKALGPVFAACGLLLLFSIVFEGRVRFGVLSAGQAYLILAVACAAAALLDRKHTPAVPVCLGILGAALTGLLLEFPEPDFAYLAALFVAVNAAAYSMRSRARCRWLKWAVLVLTVFFWFLWVLRLRVNEAQGIPGGPEMSVPLLVPCLLIYGGFYIAPVFWTLFVGSGRIGRFETLLPTVSLLGAYVVAVTVPARSVLGEMPAPAIGVACAAVFLLFAFALSCRNRSHTRAAAAFAVPAVVLLAAALPQAAGSPARAIVLWSMAALGVAVRSTAWRARKVRTSTYLLQAYGCGVAIASGVFATLVPLPLGTLILALTLAALSAAHYAWCRWTPSRHDASWMDTVDPRDLARLLPLFAATAYALAAGRLVLYVACQELPAGAADFFVCGQTVMISVTAVLLALLALKWMNHEMLGAAALVALAGAAKLFVYDLFTIGGAPIVLDVFSFALAAAIGSLIWRRYAAQMESSRPAGNGRCEPQSGKEAKDNY